MLKKHDALRLTGTLGHVTYAIANASLARGRQDMSAMDTAVKEIQAALVYHPENRYVAAMAIEVFLSAHQLAKLNGEAERSEEYLYPLRQNSHLVLKVLLQP